MAHVLLRIQNPMTHSTGEGKFTSYLIYIETDNLAFSLKKSNIRRRYSEFVWFRDTLAKTHPDIVLPSFPPKTFFRDRFDANLIEDRKTGLEEFLSGLVSETRYLSDNAVHLFLQSPLSVPAIEAIMANPQGRSVSEIITMQSEQSQGMCQDCHKELHPSDGEGAASPPEDLPGITNSSTTCAHDIFSPTRPHSFDFSHCVMGRSGSYDSSEEGHMSNMAAAKGN